MRAAKSQVWESVQIPSALDADAPIIRPKKKIAARDYRSVGAFPIIDQSQSAIAGRTDDTEAVLRPTRPVIVFGDHTRAFKLVEGAFAPGADGTLILNPSAEFEPWFLYFACIALEIPSRGYNRHYSVLKEMSVPKPPLAEQRRIAAVLGKVQAAVEVEGELVRVTRELKQAALRRLFTRGLRGEPQKQTALGPVPESWDVVPLGSLATKISKGSSPKWQGFEYVREGVLFVRSQNVGEGVMNWSERAFLPPAWNEKEPRSILREGDVLLNLVGASIGRAALGGSEIEGANCNQAVCFVRLKQDLIAPALVAHFLNSPAGLSQMHFQKKDVARANLSLDDVRGFLVPLPAPAEQRQIAAHLAAIDAKLAHHEARQRLLRELFRTLLRDLLTARRRVPEGISL